MKKRNFDDQGFLIIDNVRLSYPHLDKPSAFDENAEKKYSSQFILDPEDPQNAHTIDIINAQFAKILKQKNKGKKLADEKLCLRDGDTTDRPEVEGKYFLTVSSKTKPLMVKKGLLEKTDNTADAGIYAGCYVNAKVRFWFQDNKYGKRINANLVTVQWCGEGEPFDGSFVDDETAMSGFDVTEADIEGVENDEGDLSAFLGEDEDVAA